MKILNISFLLLLISCHTGKKATESSDEDRTDELVKYMSGSFSSTDQASSSSAYYDISLHMYPIWTDRNDGYWLYVEQAVSDNPGQPYRQRVYHVIKTPKAYESRVYELPNPTEVVRGWVGGTPLDKMGPDDLIERKGCTVYLQYDKEKKVFEGATRNATCASSLRGAAYAESEVVIGPDRITSWDRGFDANGQQVWGAKNGPYIFTEMKDLPD